MYLVFVDDTRQTGRRRTVGPMIALGAVAFSDDHVKPFADEFWSVYDRFGVPRDAELKWSPDSKTSWWRDPAHAALLTPVREAIIDAAVAHEAVAFVVAWDETAHGFGGDTPERLVLKFLYERVLILLQNSSNRGIFIFDRYGGGRKREDSWLDDSLALTDLGTEYVTAEGLVIPIVTADSKHHPHLQFADLIAGSVTAALVGKKYGLELADKIKPLFQTNWHGQIGGTGVKLWPNARNNLHHWVFGEKSYLRGGVGLPLPSPAYALAEDDGLS